MALFASNLAPASTDRALGAAKILRSLRFDGNDSNTQHLVRTPSSTGNQKIWTFSAWIKRGTGSGSGPDYIYAAHDGSDYFALYFRYNELYSYFSPGNNYGQVNARKLRDTSSWFHLVHQVDATNTTQSIWINGEALSLDSDRNPGNSNYPMNESGVNMYVGKASWRDDTIDGYMAEVNHIDGSLIAPTDFGFTDPVTNIWMPKRYEGTYGTNGFYLDFSDNSSTAALGIDKSPNGNDFTVNNFSVAAWPDGDSVIDTPTNNFCTLNDIDRNDNVYLANGSLQTAASATGGHYPVFTTIPVKSGKWYLEWKFLTNDSGLPSIMEAIHDENSYNTDSTVGNNTSTVNKRGYGFLPGNGNTSSSSGYASYGSALTSSDTGQCAFDADTGKIYWGKNNTWFNSGNPETGANPAFSGIDMTKEYLFTWHVYGNNNNVSVNFGSQGFTYTPPSGFKSLCTENLSLKQAPSAVTKPQRHFDILLYTGNGATQSITGLEFAPDFVWIKERSSTSNHTLGDTVRGANKILESNDTDAEHEPDAGAHRFKSFDPSGFTHENSGAVNQSSQTYVAWCWKAGGAAVTNTDGDITSQVSVNEEAGFSIATYTGSTASGALTVGHGLGKKPAWVIIKRRDDTGEWIVGHQGLATDAFANNKFLKLDSTSSTFTNSLVFGAEPTTTVTQIVTNGAGGAANLTSSGTYVMYSWAEIPGFSKFGGYTGNGSSTGQFVHLGFRPAFVLIKRTSANQNWWLLDNKRNEHNVVDKELNPNTNQSEATFTSADFLSNGIKFRSSDVVLNGSGSTYIYIAFAEQPGVTPFDVVSNAR